MSKIKLEGNALGTGTITFSAPNTNTDRTITLPDADVTVGLPDAIDVDASAPADSVAIDSSGKVGIGTTPASTSALQVFSGSAGRSVFRHSGGDGGITVTGSGASSGAAVVLGNNWTDDSGTGFTEEWRIALDGSNDSLQFKYNGNANEAMRIDSSGNLLVGNTSSITFGTDQGVSIASNGRTLISCSGTGLTVGRKDTNGWAVTFMKDATQVGNISVTASSTAYNTSSDYRLKTDVQPMVNATERLKALKPVNFEWIADGTRVDGFLAHEAQEVVPEAVTGTKDAVDDEGNPEYQGIDQSKLTPLLTAALQEAIAKIEDLESRLAALETV